MPDGKQFAVGDVVIGQVSEVAEYGLRVKVGILDAVLHISDLPVPSLGFSRQYEVGDSIRAKILHLDHEACRAALALVEDN
jgi:ribosomal protein S1